jgi:beta-glucosidase
MRYLKLTFFLFLGILISHGTIGQTIDEKVDSVLNLMTLAEKVGQMAQAERSELENLNDIATFGLGSLLSGGGSSPSPNTAASWAGMYDSFQSIALQSNLGIPLLYGVDAVHGHNNVYGAVIFPHNIGLGCTWNPELVTLAGQITAKEVAATGLDWTFAPCIAVPQNERWGRTYEGFGETAEIQEIMAGASVAGLQGSDLTDPETILACAKHYVGDGGTQDGIDQGNTIVSEEVLRELHLPGYIDAIEAGAGSIMASFNSWNGEKLHGHEYLLTTVLKDELGFEGFIVSDWKGVDQLDEDYREAIKRAINAGIDMVMVPDRYEVFIGHLISLVEENEVSEDRIDDAVRRILKQKFLLNLFEEPFTDPELAVSFGSQEHRDVARQAVRESIVLLNAKNDVLPLQKDGQTILVAGTLASDLGAQCGGWSISWQGATGNITPGTDVLSGIENIAGTSEVIYSPTGDFDEPGDAAIVVIGEKTPYAEGAGDRTELNLDPEDRMLIKKIKEQGISVIALLISGRPMILSDLLPYTDAMVAVWYPGTEGDGIAEVLFGDFEISGQLTHSWPKNMDQVPINFGDDAYAPLFAYKHGLQSFPSAAASEVLLPYAAVAESGGNVLMLTLTDQVTTLNYQEGDFSVSLNNTVIPGLVTEVNTADFDESVLLIHLSNPPEQSDNITLSWTGTGIFSSDLQLEAFSNFYVHNVVTGSGGIHQIPGKIEAEDYFDMFGIQTEPCEDIGGGLNVGYIESGDWMTYQVDVIQTGMYELTGRISGFQGGNLLFTFDGSNETILPYTSTNGWQNWQNFTTQVFLEAGSSIMKAQAQSDAFNINYYELEITQSISSQFSNLESLKVFPNPVKNIVHLEFTSLQSQAITIRIIDIEGNFYQLLYSGKTMPGKNNYRFDIDREISPGVYFLEIKDHENRYFKKIIIE